MTVRRRDVRVRLAVAAVAVAAVALAQAASADSVKLANGLTYGSVTVVGFRGGVLFFDIAEGKTISKKLTAVRRISIAGRDDFNAAEAARVAGKVDEATRLYGKARKSAKDPWLEALIAARIEPADGARPTPTTGHPSPTTTGPSPTSPPAPAVDPLSSPEALGRLLYSEPTGPSYSGLTSLQKAEREKAFRAKLDQWRRRNVPIGKEVTWVLSVADVDRDRATGKLVLNALSSFGLEVRVLWSAEHKAALTKVSKGDLLIVKGVVSKWQKVSSTFKLLAHEASFVLVGASMSKGGAYPRGGAATEGVRHIAFVIDRSGSMLDQRDYLKRDLRQAISKLGLSHSFHIIYFANGLGEEGPGKRLVQATQANKARTIKFLGKFDPHGGSPTDPLAAIKRGFKVLARAPGGKGTKAMFLLTDGDFMNNKQVVTQVRVWNRVAKVQVNTIFYGNPSSQGDILKKLTQIAQENNGTFTRLTGKKKARGRR